MNFWLRFTIISIIALLGNLTIISKRLNDKHSIIAAVTMPASFLMIAYMESVIFSY